MREFIVYTHAGEERTVAKSAAKALANVKWRYRRMGFYGPYTYWEVREVR